MCTLTFTDPRGQDAEEIGGRASSRPLFEVWFNRDELRTRAAELPPREAVSPGGVRYLAPTDGEAGGTWFSVNELGICVALLNGYRDPKGPVPDAYRSRGALVRGLAGCASAKAALEELTPSRLAAFRPAVVVVLAPGETPLSARWDGVHATVNENAMDELPFTSSSYEQDAVIASRRSLFERMTRESGGALDSTLLRAFQCHTDPATGPDAFSPSMSRPDAATRSQLHALIYRERVELHYGAGPPHDPSTPWESFSLSRP